MQKTKQVYLRIDDALLLRISARADLASVTRLARMAAYSLCFLLGVVEKEGGRTYGSILGSLSVTALQRNAVALVLETLRGDQSLDLGSLGVWLLALTLRLDFTTNDKLADL